MKISILIIFIVCLSSCRVGVDPCIVGTDLESTLQALMQEAIDDSFNQVSGVSLTVLSPKLKWSGVSGFDSSIKENALETSQPFRIASVTKTYTAAAILRLHEMDTLNIEESIEKFISPIHIAILKSDGYNTSQITIKHCLTHTSGLYDYALTDGRFLNSIKNDSQKKWTRTQQLEKAVKWGEKIGKPGEHYGYSDTGYVLLGEIIEKYYEGNLGLGFRKLLQYESLGIKSTWLEGIEPKVVKDKYVRRYNGRVDASEWDASIDLYGGGGIVSTSSDIAHFYHNLFNHKVFDKKTTLELMLSQVDLDNIQKKHSDSNFKDYRHGLWQVDIFGHKAYMHTGFWGTTAMHIPELNSTIVANFTSGNSERMIKKVALSIINSQKKASNESR